MNIRILNSGSDGNCSILTDCEGNQLMFDCGVPYNDIAKNVSMILIDGILITHAHQDHIQGLDRFKKFGFDIYSPKNIEDGKIIDLPHWKIMPMKVVHNVDCFSFLVLSKVENKQMAYITDTIYIPNMNLEKLDLLYIETNYDQEMVDDILAKGSPINYGYKHHLSIQRVIEYLEIKNTKVKNIIAAHTSNSGLIKIPDIPQALEKYAEKVFIAQPKLSIDF